MNNLDYRNLNIGLSIAILSIFIYPITVKLFHINIKQCVNNLNCSTCGITSDFYNIITFKYLNIDYKIINNKSQSIFILFLTNLISRLTILYKFSFCTENENFKKYDFVFLFTCLFYYINLLNNNK